MLIYKINFPNGKFYIGLTTKSLSSRISKHIHSSKKRDHLVCKAIRKYKITQKDFEVIEYCDSVEELKLREVYWIDFYKSYTNREDSNGYNLTLGGDGTFGFKSLKPISEVTRNKLRLARLGKVMSEDTKEKLRITSSKQRHTEEAKLKISKAGMGRVRSEATNNKFRATMLSKPKFTIVKTDSQLLRKSLTQTDNYLEKYKLNLRNLANIKRLLVLGYDILDIAIFYNIPSRAVRDLKYLRRGFYIATQFNTPLSEMSLTAKNKYIKQRIIPNVFNF